MAKRSIRDSSWQEVSLQDFLKDFSCRYVLVPLFGEERLCKFEKEESTDGTFWITEIGIPRLSCEPEDFIRTFLRLDPRTRASYMVITTCSAEQIRDESEWRNAGVFPSGTTILSFSYSDPETSLDSWIEGRHSGLPGWPKDSLDAFLSACVKGVHSVCSSSLPKALYTLFESLRERGTQQTESVLCPELARPKVEATARSIRTITETVFSPEGRLGNSVKNLEMINQKIKEEGASWTSLSQIAAFCLVTGQMPDPDRLTRKGRTREER